MVLHVEADDRVVLALLKAGRISEQAALRREAIERALAAVVEQWAQRWLAEK